MDISFAPAEEKDLEQIISYLRDFVLDDEDLMAEQFTVAKSVDRIIGFGRIKHYRECDELCSLGVAKEYRNTGVGAMLVRKLIQQASNELYVVCIIPTFFERFGFKEIKKYPDPIFKKHKRCTEEYVVPEPYCVMRLS